MPRKNVPSSRSHPQEFDDWENRLSLKAAEYKLQLEVLELRDEVQSLREWKKKASRCLVELAPKRNRLVKEKEDISVLKKKVDDIQKNILNSLKLQEKIQELQEQLSVNQQLLNVSKKETESIQLTLKEEQEEHKKTKIEMENLKSMFLLYMEELESFTKEHQKHSNHETTLFYHETIDYAMKKLNKEEKIHICMNMARKTFNSLLGIRNKQKTLIQLLQRNIKVNENQYENLVKKYNQQYEYLNEIKIKYSIEKEIVKELEELQGTKDRLLQQRQLQFLEQEEKFIKTKETMKTYLEEIQLEKELLKQEIKTKFGFLPYSIEKSNLFSKILFIFNWIQSLE